MIWHPFTSQASDALPLKIVRAEREYLFDADGKRYIDAIASWWTMIHGHNHPEIVGAINTQLQSLDHVMLAGFTHESAERLDAALMVLTDRQFTYTFFSDNGSTAVEIMLKLAVQYWHNIGAARKNTFIKFESAYHGDTVGAMSAGGASVFNRAFEPMLFRTEAFRYPQTDRDLGILDEIEQFVRQNRESVAGIVIEPLIAAAGGMHFQEPQLLRAIEKICRNYDLLLLLDEVFTGLGRTGEIFAFNHAQVAPDMITLAKGLTGGVLPLAVTLANERVHSAFVSSNPLHTFYHGHTMTGNPVGCAAALASLDLIANRGVLANTRALQQKMLRYWRNLESIFPEKISGARSLGAVSAANLQSRGTPSGYVFAPGSELRHKALESGVILRPLGDVIYVTPPYNISDAALEKIFSCLGELLNDYEP
jgi:adenosylmethionine---8-amino-7-oxononanoate aminotransferase